MKKLNNIEKIANKQSMGIHEGAIRYNRQFRSSEVIGNYNQDIDKLISNNDRIELVNKSRFLTENVSFIKTAIEQLSSYCVGDSFLPLFTGDNTKKGAETISWLSNWFDILDLYNNNINQLLTIVSNSIDEDGDIGILLTSASDGKYPKIQLIPSHQIRTVEDIISTGIFKNYRCIDGVIVNENKLPIGYNIITSNEESVQVSVQDMLLIFESKKSGQLRGFPSISAVIHDIQDFRDIKDFEREAIKQASSISLIEKNPIASQDPGMQQFGNSTTTNNKSDSNIYYQYMKGGMIRYFGSNDPNCSIEQMVNNRPGADTVNFINNYLLKGIFSCIGIPYEIVFDLQGLSGANTRAILTKFERKIVQRQILLYKVWKRISIYGIAKAMKYNYVSKHNEWYMVEPTFPKLPSIDIGRDIKSEIDLYKIGGNTLSDMYGKNGLDWESKVKQKIKERVFIEKMCKESNVDINSIQMLTPNGNTPGADVLNQ